MSTVADLLEKVAQKYDITIDLLRHLLNIERTFLYVAEGNPRYVIDRLRETIKEAAK